MKRLFLFFLTITLTIGAGTNAYAVPDKYSSDYSSAPDKLFQQNPGDLMNTGTFRLDDTIRGEVETEKTASQTKSLTHIEPDHEYVFGRLPMHFEPNLGQTAEEVKFTARGRGYTLYLTNTEAVFTLQTPEKVHEMTGKQEHLKTNQKLVDLEPSQVLRMHLGGNNLNKEPKITGLEKQAGVSNYIQGNDKNKWQTGVPHYNKVEFEDIYPGIDLVYYGNPQQLEYDFVVEPGANPNQIQLAFEGADNIQVAKNGNLNIKMADRELAFRAPVIYQMKYGKKQTITGNYLIQQGTLKVANEDISPTTQVGFQLAAYDTSLPLVIDPVLEYSTYLGGSSDDVGNGIAVDVSGNMFVTGNTLSTDFPTANAAYPTLSGSYDVFITQLDSSGQLVYSTYLGGNSSRESSSGIAVDASGNAFVTGLTESTDFPLANAAYTTNAGLSEVFVTQLDSTGQLVYSTYLGGSRDDYGNDIAVDEFGNAFVTGYTDSDNFPIANPAYASNSGFNDVFVTNLDSNGRLVYSTYLGGALSDFGRGIAVDATGNAFVTGSTDSTNFPTADAASAPLAGGYDVFITQLDSSGQFVDSIFLGGGDDESGRGIAVNTSGNVFVTGNTDSINFPTVNPIYAANSGQRDVFVVQLDSAGQLVYSTYLGGSQSEEAESIAVDAGGNATVVGATFSRKFPTANAIYVTKTGGRDAFVTQLDSSGQLRYSTYLGGEVYDSGNSVVVDNNGDIILSGHTWSFGFPTVNATDSTYNGHRDAFITKISGPFELALPLDSVITSPASNQTLTAPVDITGTATAPNAVANVLVGIRDNITGLWWTGSSWGDWILNPSTVTPAGVNRADWHYQFDPTGTSGSGNYRIYTRVVDINASREDPSTQVSFIVEDIALLDSVITSPTEHETVTLPHTILGTAVAPEGVGNVLIGIRDSVTKLWWTGSDWGDWVLNDASISEQGATQVDWNYHFDPINSNGSGRYRIYTRAVDINGERQLYSTQLSFIGL